MAKATPPIDVIDQFTGYPVGMATDHAYIHKGIGFKLAGVTTSIAAAGVYAVSLTTPEAAVGRYVHLRPASLSSTANTVQMRIAEGSSISGGNGATPRNKNRNSKRTSTVSCLTAVTISTEGAILDYAQAGSGANAASASGGVGDPSADEWVLKPGTTYTFRFENVGATTATVATYGIFWYEEGEGV